mmetsp:Transcript_21129/g.26773  ORF Transcript_21129/g.26773 Transcript_21129/m.26773 type:complete len:202 (+) Transcript_21129:1846-2451(+)
MSSGIEQARRHASKLALVFVLIAFVLAIVVFFTPFWYKVSYNSVLGSVTFSAGLIQTRTCDGDCSSQSFPDDEEGDYRSARLTAIICMSLAFFFTVLYFLATGLQISGKRVGPLDQGKLAIANLVLVILITVLYCATLILFPIIYGGDSTSFEGYLQDFSSGYSWSYYFLIPIIILTGVAAVILGLDASSKLKNSGYSPMS